MKRIMINSTLIILVLASNGIYASGSTTVINCCNNIGNNITSSSNCNCAGGSIGQAARGDVVKINTTSLTPIMLPTNQGATGSITIPAPGSLNLYQYGAIKIVFASFYLQLVDQKLNPKVDPTLQRIINTAAAKYPWAKTMVWVGRSLPGETTFTEVTETYTDLADLAKAEQINYEAIDSKTAKFTIPASKNATEQDMTINFNPIKKQRN